ncbi:hypothetical protein [Pseudocolwellia agarivorans]|uniref:hypothetical protein n=1 Tax=Pseudocolwellia agarivorans TaxID=1911682 RepID=UPI003F883983
MDVDQASLDRVENKLAKQSAILAGLGAILWSIPSLVLWYCVYSYFPQFSTMMLIANGIIIGFAVRFHGKGLSVLFSIIALITHTWVTYVALSLNIVINGTTWGIILFGCYAVGAGASIFLARISIPFEDHRAHSFIDRNKGKLNNTKFYNKWFFVLPFLITALGGTSFLTAIGLMFFAEVEQARHEQYIESRVADKEIDITPKTLELLTTKNILLYAYAYQKGLLFDANGRASQQFVKSEYKAKTLLKFLIEQRDNARAKFIFGHLTNDAAGKLLVQEAAEQGDQYAHVYSLIDYGCNIDHEKAKSLLSNLQNLARSHYIKEEIESVLYVGFPAICDFDNESEFLLSHIINYKE